jgi:methylated-DNA-[protein]-cysteine S-methyltransferase
VLVPLSAIPLSAIPGAGVVPVAEILDGRLEAIRFVAPGAVGETPGHDESSATDRAAARRVQGAVSAYLTGECDHIGIEVDLDRCGPFASDVYRALGEIRAGEVVTYGELARRSGHTGAARAVGGAMATNPWPLVVPCHRVVPASGGLGAYQGGAAVKAWLLAREGVGLR